MTAHLLLISLGPVQDFIVAARKCQDLWFGSYLLSELSAQAARALPANSLIFPGSRNPEGGVANKILARLKPGEDPQNIAEQSKAMVMEHLRDLAKEAWPNDDPEFEDVMAQEQLNELIEFFWVAVPVGESYQRAHHDAEQLLASRKLTKDWGFQKSSTLFEAEVPPRKSSLNGIRESVIKETAFKTPRTWDEKKELVQRFYRKYRMNLSERLCSIGMLKRRGSSSDKLENIHGRPAFHSSSHMAASPLLVRIARMGDRGAQATETYIRCLKDNLVDFSSSGENPYLSLDDHKIRLGTSTQATELRPIPPLETNPSNLAQLKINRAFLPQNNFGFDGVLFFDSRIAPDIFQSPLSPNKDGVLLQAQKVRQGLREFLDNLGVQEIPPYYCMLMADGDRMGDAIQKLAAEGMEKHRELSTKLEDFAQQTKGIIESFGGSLIYSGGDDIFAILPLHGALDCADKLRKTFQESFSTFNLETPPTLSCGLAFVHHLLPMDRARRLAKQAETNAKQKAGRNALAIILDKRSGVTLEIEEQWDPGSQQSFKNLKTRLKEWTSHFLSGEVPNGVAFELKEMLKPFSLRPKPAMKQSKQEQEREKEKDKEAIDALARRIFSRKKEEGAQAALSPKILDKLHQYLEYDQDPIRSINQLSNELQIARLLAKSYELAWGDLPNNGGQ